MAEFRRFLKKQFFLHGAIKDIIRLLIGYFSATWPKGG